jgi:hypothetical protein
MTERERLMGRMDRNISDLKSRIKANDVMIRLAREHHDQAYADVCVADNEELTTRLNQTRRGRAEYVSQGFEFLLGPGLL